MDSMLLIAPWQLSCVLLFKVTNYVTVVGPLSNASALSGFPISFFGIGIKSFITERRVYQFVILKKRGRPRKRQQANRISSTNLCRITRSQSRTTRRNSNHPNSSQGPPQSQTGISNQNSADVPLRDTTDCYRDIQINLNSRQAQPQVWGINNNGEHSTINLNRPIDMIDRPSSSSKGLFIV